MLILILVWLAIIILGLIGLFSFLMTMAGLFMEPDAKEKTIITLVFGFSTILCGYTIYHLVSSFIR